MAMLSGDEEYMLSRSTSRRRANMRSGHLGHGLRAGAEGLAKGIGKGLGGLVTAPALAVKKEGLWGLGGGFAKGLTGAVVKPAVGAIDMAEGLTLGIRNTATIINTAAGRGAWERRRLRPPRAPTGQEDGRATLAEYDGALARGYAALKGQEIVVAHSRRGGGDDGGGGGDEEGGAAEDALNNMVVEGQGRSHILQVATRLEFLHFALSRASALCLDLDAVNALWDSVHDDALTIKERNLLLKWLQVACRMQSRGHTFMEDGVALELFRQKMTRSDGDRAAYWEEMSEEGFACLESFFLLVNERSGQLYQEGGGSGGKVHVRVLPEKLEGMLSLWRVALEAANSTLGYVRLR